MANILRQDFLDQYFREKVGENIYSRVPYEDVLKQHPAYPALDLSRVQTGTIGGNLKGQYDKLPDITTLDINPNRITKHDLQKLMHETTHRAMNVDPGVVAALGVSARNIPYTKGKWEWNPKDFGFDEGPTLKPSDPSEIFTRRADVDTWDGKIANQGEFMTDIEVADAVKANKLFHDPILDRKTGVHWQTRGAGAAPGESLRARKGIRGVFDPYVDKFKEAMTKYKGGENYYADYIEAKKLGISTRDYIKNVKEELGEFDNYLGVNQNQRAQRFERQQLMNRRKQTMQQTIRRAEAIEAAKKTRPTNIPGTPIVPTGGGGISNINIQKRNIGMPENLTYTPPRRTVTPRHAPSPHRGGYEGSGGSAQGGGGGPPGGEAGWKGARGGYVDKALGGRSRYL